MRWYRGTAPVVLLVAILLPTPAAGDASTISRSTRHLKLTASLSSRVLTPGGRTTLIVDVEPRRGMHVYAPGSKYQAVKVVIAPQPALKMYDTVYPPAKPYYFKPLNETVDVYDAPFRLRIDVAVVDATAASGTRAGSSVVLNAALEYQACDDRVCYLPETVPLVLAADITGTAPSTRRRR